MQASSVIPATELHGMVCGFAAGSPLQFSLSDFVALAGADDLSDENSVSEFVTATLDELFSQDMGFTMLIPDDEEVLSARLAGIAEWCAGFLSGFGASVADVSSRDALPVDVQEILRDFASISSIDDEVDADGEGGDRDESSFMEIYEYVRVAAVLTATLMTDPAQEAEGAGSDDEIEH